MAANTLNELVKLGIRKLELQASLLLFLFLPFFSRGPVTPEQLQYNPMTCSIQHIQMTHGSMGKGRWTGGQWWGLVINLHLGHFPGRLPPLLPARYLPMAAASTTLRLLRGFSSSIITRYPSAGPTTGLGLVRARDNWTMTSRHRNYCPSAATYFVQYLIDYGS